MTVEMYHKLQIEKDPYLMRLREYYVSEYRLSDRAVNHLTAGFLIQLTSCKSDEARRLLLGVSK